MEVCFLIAQESKRVETKSEFWTSTEFGEVINVSPTTLKKLLKSGQIKGAHQFGKQWRIHKETFYKQIKEDME